MLFLLEMAFLSGAGCDLFRADEPQRRLAPAQNRGRMEDALEFVQSFMDARMAAVEDEELEAYLTNEAKMDYRGQTEMALIGSAEESMLGYILSNASEVTPGGFGFSVAIQSSYINRPFASNLREDLIIRVIEDEYRVASTRFLKRSAISVLDSALIWENNNLSRTLMRLTDLPSEFAPIGADGVRFGSGREGFTTLAVRHDDQEVAFGTRGIHGLVGVISTARQEPPVVLDLIFEGQARRIVYSPDGRYLAIEESAPTGSTRIRVYHIEEKRLLNLGLSEAFSPDRYHLNIHQWETGGRVVLIEVNRFAPDAPEEPLGIWAIDINNGDRQKVIQ